MPYTPATTNVAAMTCDCCGFVVDLTANPPANNYLYDAIIDKYFCVAKGCTTKFSTGLLTSGFTALKAAHTALIAGGVIPNHP